MKKLQSNGLFRDENSERVGHFTTIRGGKLFWPMDPRPDEIDVYDIANALAKVCRFGGHPDYFYSVAQHAVHVSRLVPAGFELEGLHHDDAEYILADVIRPIKHDPSMRGYLNIASTPCGLVR